MNLKKWLRRPNALVTEKWLLQLFALWFLTTQSWSQGTMQFIFSGPAYPGAPAPTPRGTFLNTAAYSEAGMVFWNREAPRGVVLVGGGIASMPENGTPYLVVGPGDRLSFGFSDVRSFDLIAFDVAEEVTNFPGPASLHVVGYAYEGRAVAADIMTDGINDGTGPLPDFQTFMFGDLFRNIYRVEITTDRFSLDNVLLGIPEPGTGALVAVGGALLASRLLRRGTHP